VQRLGKAAMSACSKCADFITHKRPIIEEASAIAEEAAALIAVLLPRIRAATRRTAEAFQQGKEHREKIEKRVLASRYVARKDILFKKYNSKEDGYMSEGDVQAYAKAEYNFDIPIENMKKIEKKLFEGGVGVPREEFQTLKAAVGIARAEVMGRQAVIDRAARLEKETKEKAERHIRFEERKTELKEIIKEQAKALTELEPDIKKAEKVAEALAGEAGQLGAEELKAKSDKVDAETADTKQRLDDIRQNLEALATECESISELQEVSRGILKPLSSRSDIFDMRLKKALETASSGRQLAQYMALSEYEGLWTEVVVKLRACIETNDGKSAEDLFDFIAGSDITVPENAPGSEMDTITTTEIQAFLAQSKCEVEIEKLDKLFGRGAPGKLEGDKAEEAKDAEEDTKEKKEADKDAGKLDIAAAAAAATAKLAEQKAQKQRDNLSKEGLHITRSDFKRIIRMYYKVVRHCVLSDNLQIEQSSQIRRMDVGEVLEVHKGPILDSSVNVYRIFGRCIRDGINGWATIAGNTGVTFMMPGGRIFTVKIGCPLTEELKDVEGFQAVRTLAEGEVLEVLEWARTSRSALGVTRIRARAQTDNAVGWVTVVGNDERTYLEAM